jgi:adenosylhomocysteine nucleosidase
MRTCLTLAWLLWVPGALSAAAPAYTAVLSAYPPETEAVRRQFAADPGGKFTRHVIAGVAYDTGVVSGRPVLLFQAGMSLVNAAYQLQIALDHFPVARVLFAGVAGGVSPDLAVADVVIPDRWAYHAEAAYLNPDGKGGYVVPEYFHPQLKNFGMIFPDAVAVIREGESEAHRQPFFASDPALLRLAERVAPQLRALTYGGRPIHIRVGGTGVTGPVFLDNADYREWVHRVWDAECTDMESTAYAQVCWANHIPFLIVRGLSDLAGGQHAPNPINENEDAVAVLAAKTVRAIFDQLPP